MIKIKKLQKFVLIFLLPFLFVAGAAYASILTVPQGGTGISSVSTGTVISGNGTSPLIPLTVGSGLTISGTTISTTDSGLAIGNPVGGGDPNDVLFNDGSGNLGQDDNFVYNQGSGLYQVGFDNGAVPFQSNNVGTTITGDWGTDANSGNGLFIDSIGTMLGNDGDTGNGTEEVINDPNEQITDKTSSGAMLDLDQATETYTMGDPHSTGDGDYLQILSDGSGTGGSFAFENKNGTRSIFADNDEDVDLGDYNYDNFNGDGINTNPIQGTENIGNDGTNQGTDLLVDDPLTTVSMNTTYNSAIDTMFELGGDSASSDGTVALGDLSDNGKGTTETISDPTFDTTFTNWLSDAQGSDEAAPGGNVLPIVHSNYYHQALTSGTTYNGFQNNPPPAGTIVTIYFTVASGTAILGNNAAGSCFSLCTPIMLAGGTNATIRNDTVIQFVYDSEADSGQPGWQEISRTYSSY